MKPNEPVVVDIFESCIAAWLLGGLVPALFVYLVMVIIMTLQESPVSGMQ